MNSLSLEPKLQNRKIFFFWLKREENSSREALLIFLTHLDADTTLSVGWDVPAVQREQTRSPHPRGEHRAGHTRGQLQGPLSPCKGSGNVCPSPSRAGRGWWGNLGLAALSVPQGVYLAAHLLKTHVNPRTSRDRGDDALGKSC